MIQRFGSALNLNAHPHLLFLDGVYVEDNKYGSAMRFQWVNPHTSEELAGLTHTITKRIGRYLERQGRKLSTLQTMPASDPEEWVCKVGGFSLHAGVAAKTHERKNWSAIKSLAFGLFSPGSG